MTSSRSQAPASWGSPRRTKLPGRRRSQSLMASRLFSHEGTKARKHERDEAVAFSRSQTPFGNALAGATPLRWRVCWGWVCFSVVSLRAIELRGQWRSQIEFGNEKNEKPAFLFLSFLRAFVPSCLRVKAQSSRFQSDQERERTRWIATAGRDSKSAIQSRSEFSIHLSAFLRDESLSGRNLI